MTKAKNASNIGNVEPKTLQDVFDVVQSRRGDDPKTSYVASLLSKGVDKILKKVGEESGEVIIAFKNDDREEQVHEIADLWFHTLVLMADAGLTPADIENEFGKRFGTSGHAEKAARNKN